MIHTTTLKCPHCGSKNPVKQGKTGNGTQKWQCNSCKKTFSPGIPQPCMAGRY